MTYWIGTSGYQYPAWRGHFYPEKMPESQMLYFQDAEPVPGTNGAITLANILTALQAAAATLAGASGTPLITAAALAQINAWNSGLP